MKILTIGRKDADIVLDDRHNEISRLHAELTITNEGTYYLVDCGSSNGTSIRRQSGWESIKQDYVKREDQLRFGGHYVITLQDLLRMTNQA